jgi:hypothetical protein
VTSGADRLRAVKQFTVSAELAAKYGPQGESCSSFMRGFRQSHNDLRAAGF